MSVAALSSAALPSLAKCPTGIAGFDDITEGGLPRGRPTLLIGHAGTGKTLLGLEFVLRGVERFGDAGVFVSFEESAQDLSVNVASIGFDIAAHEKSNHLRVLRVALEPHEIVEAGEFDLDGLFLRLGAAIDAIGARRIVLDGVENLFSAFADLRTVRAEFRRLMTWFKDREITAIVTTERGTDALTRHGLEEYIADCVVTLDNRIEDQIATRRLRVVKYRGSTHGSDECPFIVTRNGFSVMPITSAGLSYEVSAERVPSGIGGLDELLTGGIFRGSSVLVTGTAGTGKSSVAAQMADAACRRGERCLYVALEESPDQIERNMRSIGIDLGRWRAAGPLRFHAARPTSGGLETHLAVVASLLDAHRPTLVVVDPISALTSSPDDERVKLMLIRMVDLIKSRGVTSVFTALTRGDQPEETTAVGISSLMDVWLLLRNLERAGERTRALYVCKARGMAHSNQIREFLLTNRGVEIVEVQIADDGTVLTGSARQLHQLLQRGEESRREANERRRRAMLESRRAALDARIAAMRAEYEEELRRLEQELAQEGADVREAALVVKDIGSLRSGPSGAGHQPAREVRG